MRVLYGAAEPL